MIKKLNLGAGATKIEGVETHDINGEFKCDFSFDLRKAPWPLEDGIYDEIYLFHTIEHIEKCFHKNIYQEIWRILKPGGLFLMSFPEFEIIVQYWIENKQGQREHWEHTIYGLQRTISDYHLCAMDSQETIDKLLKYGFENIAVRAEVRDTYNTVLHAIKSSKIKTYEHIVYEEVLAK